MTRELAVVGFGNLGGAVIAGAVRAGVLSPEHIVVIEVDAARRAEAEAIGCRSSASLADAAGAGCIMLAVKPQSFAAVAAALPRVERHTVVLSVMAGIRGASIRRAMGNLIAVVRAMPNTPCRIGAGMTALALSEGARPGDESLADRLFGSVGRVVHVSEEQLDAVTATSGSGPAYVFLLAEAWEDAAMNLGFDRHTARQLVRQTLLGAARMLEDDAVEAPALRTAVTSKGGTTEAAIAVLERAGWRDALREALAAATRRGRELAS